MAARHVAAVVLVDPVVRIGTPSAAPTADSPPPLTTFATLEPSVTSGKQRKVSGLATRSTASSKTS